MDLLFHSLFPMINWLLIPLRSEFMQNALLIGVLMGILCSVVGSYTIVRQMSMMGDVISHSVLAGLPIAFVMGISLSVGAMVAGIASALFLTWIESESRTKIDAAMALILSTFLALGVTLVSVLPGANRIDLIHVLFGSILGVNRNDLWLILGITLLILVLAISFYKELLFYTFDPLAAQATGMPVKWYYFGMVVAITLTVVASLQTVGLLLVIAMLAGPGSAAYLLVKQLHWMMIVAAIIGSLSSIIGMYISYYFDTPSGAAIVLVVFGFFFLAFLFSPSQGLLTRPGTRLGRLLRNRQ